MLALDPAHPRALRIVTDAAAAASDWPALVAAYQAALKARRDGDDLGMLLQIAMVLWKHLGELDQRRGVLPRGSASSSRRIPRRSTSIARTTRRRARPRSCSRCSRPGREGRAAAAQRQRRAGRSSVEIAELAEQQNNPEKAIEAWKQHLRQDPASAQARAALARLYRRTEKWNALLDLMKDEIERLPEGDVAGRVAKLLEVVEIYRDRLRLDVMVINTYNAILKIDPDNQRASDELAAKYRALGRWNDLIAILTRKAEAPDVPDGERVDAAARGRGSVVGAVRQLRERDQAARADRRARRRPTPTRSPAQGDLHEAPAVARS